MADPLSLQILNAVATRLADITVANGYYTDAGNDVRLNYLRLNDAEISDPVLCVFDTEDEPIEEHGYLDNMLVQLAITVEGTALVGASGTITANKLISDIKTACLDSTDKTLSGLTLDFGYAGRSIEYVEQNTDLVRVAVRFATLYREPYGSP